MKKIVLFLGVSVLCMLLTVNAQNVFNPNDPLVNYNPSSPPATPPPNTLAKWVRTPRPEVNFNPERYKSYYYNGMPFRLRFPNGYNPADPNKKYPVILFFHGIGEAAPDYDNEINLLYAGPYFENKINEGQFDAFLLFPATDYGDWAPSFANINSVLDLLQLYCHADPDRLITMGLSLGGDGTLKYTFDFPQRSALSIPSSPGSIRDFTQNPAPFVHIPIWVASGGLDDQFSTPATVQAFVDRFTAAGGDIRWTFFPQIGHGTWVEHWNQPFLIPYWQSAHKANPLVFNKKTDFPAGTPFSVKIGITGGFAEYQWQKDNSDIQGAGGNEITVNQPGTYRVRFRRVAGGNWSDWSPKPAVITQPVPVDNTPPSTPANLHVVSVTTSSITLDWDNSTDNVGVTGYDVFVNGVKRYSTVNSDIIATGLDYASSYNFSVQAHDQANNFSGFSNSVFGTTASQPDVTAPSAPANLHVVSTSANSVSLDWDNSSDNVGVTGYDIFVNGNKQYSTTISDLVAGNLNPATTYTFTVQARDQANNFSAFSNAVNGTTSSVSPPADNVYPGAPGNLRVVSVTINSITLDWDNSTDNVGIAGYDVFINGVKSYATVNSDFVVGNLNANTNYTFRIQAHDLSNNYSEFSNQVNGTTSGSAPVVDNGYPGAPGNLRVVSTTNNSISLDWDNSIDNVGIAGYDVFINGVKTYATVNSDYVVPNLGANTTYTFRIQAHDLSNNYSEFSNQVSGTTSGSTPVVDHVHPGAPGNLQVISTTANSILLDWDNSVDNVGIAGYDIFINGAKTYATVNSDFVVGNLTANTTYTFRIQAHDPSNNYSEFSNQVSGTTTPGGGAGNGLNYKFYQGAFTSLPDFNTLTPVKTGSSANVDISVRTPGVNDNFAFIWQGNITIPAPGVYTFETVSDDGSKLYFNTPYGFGTTALVNNDGLHPALTAAGTVTIPSAGSYPIAFTFFEQGGGEVMEVYWSGPGIPRQRIPNTAFAANSNQPPVAAGLNYKYYQGTWTSLPNFNALTPIKTGTSASADLTVRTPGVNDNFGFVWEGYINITTPGNYTFETVSDDGSKLYFNSLYSPNATALVNNDGLHGPLTARGTVNIPSAGLYPFALTFFEQSGGETMEVYWSGPGFDRQLIPASAFRVNNTSMAGVVMAQSKEDVQHAVPGSEQGNVEIQSVYPNPFVSSFIIRFNNASAANQVGVDLVDISGRLLLKKNFGNLAPGATLLKMNVANKGLLPGVYFARLTINGKPSKLMKLVRK